MFCIVAGCAACSLPWQEWNISHSSHVMHAAIAFRARKLQHTRSQHGPRGCGRRELGRRKLRGAEPTCSYTGTYAEPTCSRT